MKKKNEQIRFKIPHVIHEQMLADLKRSHPYAAERVGFLFTKSRKYEDGTVIIIASEYRPLNDENYIRDNSVGARIDSQSIREAMQIILNTGGGCFHVHLHSHTGMPGPSSTDKKGLPGIAESFANIAPNQANGFLILSKDSFYASVKCNRQSSLTASDKFSVIGYPMHFVLNPKTSKRKSAVFDRQSFLGANSRTLFENIRVGIIGYGGGGSHVGQQLAHLGIQKVTVFDDDNVEDTNLNRMVGAFYKDIKSALPKADIAARVIKSILPTSELICVKGKWQDNAEYLQQCDVVIGCVDTYLGRQELEAECRRYLIPYIDIGMDVFKVEDGHYMSGQILLSMPGMPCMNCMGFLTDDKLAKEAAKYGNVGGRPQVVWSNGVLASTAVGIFVDLATGWSNVKDKIVYLSYDGNNMTLQNHVRLSHLPGSCNHYPLTQTGPPQFTKL